MSGGSHDYAYMKLEEIANSFYTEPEKPTYVEARKKVADILRLMSKVCHDIEWIDSSDYGQDEWKEVLKNLDKIKIIKSTCQN